MNLRIRKASTQPQTCDAPPEQRKNLWISSNACERLRNPTGTIHSGNSAPLGNGETR
jgi:hypothetical protein